jgi:hypothetical protein
MSSGTALYECFQAAGGRGGTGEGANSRDGRGERGEIARRVERGFLSVDP